MAVSPSQTPKVFIRPARLREYKALGSIAAETYFPAPFTAFLSPYRSRYFSHYLRGFQKRALSLMLDPRVRSVVACEESKPDVPVGFIHFKRLGDDEVAEGYVKEKESAWLWVLRWLSWAYYLLIHVAVGEKHQDEEAIRMFHMWNEKDNALYWDSHQERQTRYHVMSFVVLREFQGIGVGRRLMAQLTQRAEEENVYIGLEASPEGEFLVSQLCSDSNIPLSFGSSSHWRLLLRGLSTYWIVSIRILLNYRLLWNSIERLDLSC